MLGLPPVRLLATAPSSKSKNTITVAVPKLITSKKKKTATQSKRQRSHEDDHKEDFMVITLGGTIGKGSVGSVFSGEVEIREGNNNDLSVCAVKKNSHHLPQRSHGSSVPSKGPSTPLHHWRVWCWCFGKQHLCCDGKGRENTAATRSSNVLRICEAVCGCAQCRESFAYPRYCPP
eukprot:PhF_6_TR25784/c0_g1_i1/m.36365